MKMRHMEAGALESGGSDVDLAPRMVIRLGLTGLRPSGSGVARVDPGD
jgi:hypothetical protein